MNIRVQRNKIPIEIGQVRFNGEGTVIYVGQHYDGEDDYGLGLLYLEVQGNYRYTVKVGQYVQWAWNHSDFEERFPYVADAEMIIKK